MGTKVEAKGTILVIDDGPMTHHVLMSAITHMTKRADGDGCIYIYDNPLPVVTDDYDAALAAWIKYLRFDEYDDE